MSMPAWSPQENTADVWLPGQAVIVAMSNSISACLSSGLIVISNQVNVVNVAVLIVSVKDNQVLVGGCRS